jgi:hypothetical protein
LLVLDARYGRVLAAHRPRRGHPRSSPDRHPARAALRRAVFRRCSRGHLDVPVVRSQSRPLGAGRSHRTTGRPRRRPCPEPFPCRRGHLPPDRAALTCRGGRCVDTWSGGESSFGRTVPLRGRQGNHPPSGRTTTTIAARQPPHLRRIDHSSLLTC